MYVCSWRIKKSRSENLFEPIPVAIDKRGQWFIDKEPNVLLPDNSALKINTETAQTFPLMQTLEMNKQTMANNLM